MTKTLDFERKLLFVMGLAAATTASFAQSQTGVTAPLAFEVAAVRRSPPQTEAGVFTMTFDDHSPGQIHYANMSLKNLLLRAYGVEDYQIEGPDWLNTENYDITAKAPPKTPLPQRMLMLQTLLAERLHVKLHREKKEMTAYVLQVGRNAPTLQETPGPKINADGTMSGSMSGPGRLVANRQSMEGIAGMLASVLRSPVVDMTAIKGNFNLTLEWKPDDGEGGKVATGGAPERILPDSVFVALQEKTCLLLKKQKAPVDMLIIDHAEKIPTEN